MARKKLTSVSHGSAVATVYRDPEWGEYVVKLKGRPQADYFTSDKADAVATARRMVGYTGPRKLAGLGASSRRRMPFTRYVSFRVMNGRATSIEHRGKYEACKDVTVLGGWAARVTYAKDGTVLRVKRVACPRRKR